MCSGSNFKRMYLNTFHDKYPKNECVYPIILTLSTLSVNIRIKSCFKLYIIVNRLEKKLYNCYIQIVVSMSE